MELNILADGDVGNAAAVFFGELRDGAELMAGEQAVGDADAHHEKREGFAFAVFAADDADAVALGVNAPGTEVGAEPFGRNGIEAGAGELLDFVEMVPGVFGTLEALDALGLGFDGLVRWLRRLSGDCSHD